MKAFQKLTTKEKELLIKAPVYVSLLAASMDGEVDAKEREEAIHLSHLRTFTSDPALHDYYKEVEKTFESDFDRLNRSVSKDRDERKEFIKAKLELVESALSNVDKKVADLLRHSLKTYADHVSKIHRNSLEYFIFPSKIPGMTD